MSDLDQLDPRIDAAFEALTRDLAHSHGPGAGAAMATARTRRRTKAGAVALAALVVVGAGLTVPRLVSPADGVAADGGSARLDADALGAATDGWTTGWEMWERFSPKGGGGYAVPCSGVNSVSPGGPEVTSYGASRFVAEERASALLVVRQFEDAGVAASAQDLSDAPPATCATTTFLDVDGVRVRHVSMPDGAESGSSLWLGDVWSVRVGTRVAELQVVTGTEVADEDVAEQVAEALVAGVRDGWTQTVESAP